MLERISGPDPQDILGIVSVAELKQNLRISNTMEDAFIERCIKWAYQWLDGPEGFLNRAIMTQKWRLTLPGFRTRATYNNQQGAPVYAWEPTNRIELPLPPLQSVTAVKYLSSGVVETLATSGYAVNRGTSANPFGSIYLPANVSWPTVDAGDETVQIEFLCGYGDEDVIREQHSPIENAMRLLASDYFRNREDTYAEPRLVAVNRQIVNGLLRTLRGYRVMNRYA